MVITLLWKLDSIIRNKILPLIRLDMINAFHFLISIFLSLWGIDMNVEDPF